MSEAYAILSNPERRKRYDLYGETSQDDNGTSDFENFFTFDDDFMFGTDDDDWGL